MKRNISILFLAIAAVSCNTSEIVPDSQEHTYIFEIQSDSGINPDSKATLGEQFIEWESGDKIGTFAGGINNGCGDVTIASPCTFEVKTSSALSAGDKVYAYAPYSESAGTDPSSLTLVIPSEQSYNHISMPMVAVPYTVSSALAESSSSSVASMRFCNTASIVRLLVYSDGTVASGEKISGITISSSADICGSYSLDICAVNPGSEETLSLTPVSGNKSISLSVPEGAIAGSGPESAMVVPFVLSAGAHDLTISVTTDKATYIKSTSSALTFVRNHVKGLKFDLSKASVSEISVTPSQLKSFKKGTTSVYSLSMTGVSDVSVSSCPEGWSAVLDGESLSVTSPSDDTHALAGNVVLSGTASHGAYVKEIPVRLAGINNADDLAAFTTAYKNTDNSPVTSGDTVDPYLVDGEITLNADITIPSGSLAWGAYWLKRIVIPLNGNGHTLTINTKQANRGGLCQNLAANVRDLNIAGRMETTASDATSISVMGGLACYVSKDGLVVENVHSSVDMVYKSYVNGAEAGYVAGLIGSADATYSKPTTLTIRNCSFSGSITTSNHALAIGGILGHAQAYGMQATIEKCDVSANFTAVTTGWACYVGGIVGCGGTALEPGEIMNISNCTYSGTFTFKQNNQYYCRFGGIIGDLQRGAVISDCSFTGKILVDQNNKVSYSGNDRGVGGIIGRETAPNASFPNMNAKAILTRCNSKGTITITNSADTPENNSSHVRQISGCQLNTTSSHVETDCTSNSIITFEYANK